jgi:hypothetical protein
MNRIQSIFLIKYRIHDLKQAKFDMSVRLSGLL